MRSGETPKASASESGVSPALAVRSMPLTLGILSRMPTRSARARGMSFMLKMASIETPYSMEMSQTVSPGTTVRTR